MGLGTVGTTMAKTIFKCVFKGKIIKENLLQIRCTRRAQSAITPRDRLKQQWRNLLL
jgi:hypothetical protein